MIRTLPHGSVVKYISWEYFFATLLAIFLKIGKNYPIFRVFITKRVKLLSNMHYSTFSWVLDGTTHNLVPVYIEFGQPNC